MILKIKFSSMAEQKLYELDYMQNLFTFNGQIVDKDIRETYAEIMQVIKEWPECLENREVVDGLVCEISYREKGEDKKLFYNNKFPETFDNLLYILEVALDE